MKLRMKDLAPAARKVVQAERREERERQRKLFQLWCNVGADVPTPDSEFQFHDTRKWAFDFAWPGQRVALEIDGGIWTQGRHTRGAGRLADMEKQSEAAALGWRIIYRTPQNLYSDETADLIRRALAG